MRKTSIYFTERQYALLEEEAYGRKPRRTVSELVRDLITDHLGKEWGYTPEPVQRGRPYTSPDSEAIERSSPYESMDARSERAATAE